MTSDPDHVNSQPLDDFGGPFTAEGIYEFAIRLLTQPGIRPLSPGFPKLAVGTIPEGLPLKVPLPEGHRVVGTLVRNPEEFVIALDFHGTAEQLFEFLDRALLEGEWFIPTPISMANHGGFIFRLPAMEVKARLYCGGKQGPSVEVRVISEEASIANVRITVEMKSEHSRCDPRPRPSGFEMLQLPSLEAPQGSRLRPTGGGGGQHQRYSAAILYTEISLRDLLGHFGPQLVEAGWKLNDEAVSDTAAWSGWSFVQDGDQWAGILLVAQPGGGSTLHLVRLDVYLLPGG